jgi:lipopolysaccharide transport system permease protein
MSNIIPREIDNPSGRSGYERILRPRRGIPRIGWPELWEYRGLFGALAMRTFSVRYKQTVAGSLWALIQPLITMLILTIIFGRLAGFDDGKSNYALLVLSGVLPWQLFANSLSQSATSLVASAGMISKVYFPRLIVPASSCIVGLVDFMIALTILAVMMVVWWQAPTWGISLIPLFVILTLVAALGLAKTSHRNALRFRPPLNGWR